MKFFTIIVPPEKREDAVRRLQMAAFKTGINIDKLAIFQDGDYIWAECKIKTDKKISAVGVKAKFKI